MTRAFFVTDVHASDRCFRKFLNASRVYKADCLILGGDVTGKILVPLVEQPDGSYRARLFGRDAVVKKDRLDETRKELQDAGQYSFLTTPSELAEIESDDSKRDRTFNEAIASTLRSWLDLAEQRLVGTGVTCYISPGNDDSFGIDSILADSGHIVNPEDRVVRLGEEYEMITLGYANPTPWKSPREAPEDELGRMIEALASKVGRMETAIFNLHVPPAGTEIDRAPAVSETLEYVKEGLGFRYIHAGSTAVRMAIEEHAPLLGLHGHIHESKGFVRLGRTLCLNPGSEYADGILRGAVVNLERGRVKEFMLTSG